LTCTPNPVFGGDTTICTVTLNGIMPGAVTVQVSTDQPFIAPASGYLTVPAGAVSAAFSLPTLLVPEAIVAHISASVLEFVTAKVTTPLTVNLTNRGKKWVLNNVVFKDGTTVNGYFVYDQVAGQYLAANIVVTPGPDPNNPLGHPPQKFYYYPWPNGELVTVVDAGSTASVMSLKNPVTPLPISWTTLQLNFAQPLTNAGGTIQLVVDPTVLYTPYCLSDLLPTCVPPPANISQERFALPENPWVVSAFYWRVIVSGSVIAQ
jgi:hypothetical protein